MEKQSGKSTLYVESRRYLSQIAILLNPIDEEVIFVHGNAHIHIHRHTHIHTYMNKQRNKLKNIHSFSSTISQLIRTYCLSTYPLGEVYPTC